MSNLPAKSSENDVLVATLSTDERDLIDRYMSSQDADVTKYTTAQRELIYAFFRSGIKTRACKLAGISRVTMYRWWSEDPTFKDACEIAMAKGREYQMAVLQETAFERATTGESDKVLLFLLERLDREQFGREKAGGITVNLNADLNKYSSDELHDFMDKLKNNDIIDVTPEEETK